MQLSEYNGFTSKERECEDILEKAVKPRNPVYITNVWSEEDDR